MTVARSKLVDVAVTRWYHCISRCVRRAFLLAESGQAVERKDWIENRLKELDAIFAVSVGGFSIMDNHLHLLLRVDSEAAKNWSPEEVARRWFQLYPPRGADRTPLRFPPILQPPNHQTSRPSSHSLLNPNQTRRKTLNVV